MHASGLEFASSTPQATLSTKIYTQPVSLGTGQSRRTRVSREIGLVTSRQICPTVDLSDREMAYRETRHLGSRDSA